MVDLDKKIEALEKELLSLKEERRKVNLAKKTKKKTKPEPNICGKVWYSGGVEQIAIYKN